MLLMIDNYDSFTYNVVQYLGELGADVHVIRNDELSIAEIEALLQRAGYHRPVDVVGYQGQAYALFDPGRWDAVEVLRWLKEYVEEAQRQRV